MHRSRFRNIGDIEFLPGQKSPFGLPCPTDKQPNENSYPQRNEEEDELHERISDR